MVMDADAYSRQYINAMLKDLLLEIRNNERSISNHYKVALRAQRYKMKYIYIQ